MPASTVIKQLHDGIISMSDGTGTPIILSVPFTVGDLKIQGIQETQRSVNKYEARGVLRSVRHGARTYASGSFSFMVADYSDATNDTAIDFLLRQNGYSGNIGTLTPDEVYAVDIKLTVEGTDLGDSADHTIELGDCVCTVGHDEGEPNMVTVSFEILGAIAWT